MILFHIITLFLLMIERTLVATQHTTYYQVKQMRKRTTNTNISK